MCRAIDFPAMPRGATEIAWRCNLCAEMKWRREYWNVQYKPAKPLQILARENPPLLAAFL